MNRTPQDPVAPARSADDQPLGSGLHPTQMSPAGPLAPVDADDFPRVAGYTVVRKLGEGGMGAVYLAEDHRLGRRVALKTMRRDLAARPPDRDRFLREARAAAAVESDYLVPVWAVGEADDGTPYLAMPVLQGETLDARLRREPASPPGLVLKVAREVAEGLAAAHAAGLVHRDIKPANIWLEGDPAGPVRRCKVLDFGLARPVAAAGVQVTASGAVLGTPAFMAPEQARGEPVDARADLFSLGVTLYRMAAGRPPFDGPTPMALLIALTTEPPPPLREVAPGTPPDLADLIERLMAKEPDRRPRTAAEVADITRRIAGDETGEVRPAGATRSRVPLVLAAIAVLLFGVGVWLVAANRPVREVAEQDDPPAAVVPAPTEPPKASSTTKTVGPPKSVEPVKQAELPPKAVPPPPPGEADRKAALWVLSVKGAVLIDAVPDQIREARRLPKGPFRLTEVYLTEPVADAALAVFADCKHLTTAYLVGTGITNEGLAHLANCSKLIDLSLPGTKVNDEAVPAITRFTKLTGLSIGATAITAKGARELAKALPGCRIQYGATYDPATDDDRAAAEFVLAAGGKVGVSYGAADTADAKLLPKGLFRLTAVDLSGRPSATDAELDRFRECKSLTRLVLTGTPVGDAGLTTVREFTKLTYLDLRGTKVTERGATGVARALTACEVTWDGGVLRPKR